MTDTKTTKPAAKKPAAKKKELSRGVLIIALGHPYYGQYAANLAMSLLHTAPDVKICLVHDSSSISHMRAEEFAMFDKSVMCPDEYYHMHGMEQYIMSKLYINKLTPYDETLFLDADMIWHPKRSVTELMKSLSDLDFTMQNRGSQDLSQENIPEMASHWCNLNQLKADYNIKKGTWWHLSSEFIYFKKTKEVDAMFKDAQLHYKTIKTSHTQFADGIPDELCFSLAMLRHVNVVPHRLSYTPVFWNQAESNSRALQPRDLHARYFAYSMGGANNPKHAKLYYDNLVQYYARHRGIQLPFKAKDKSSFVKGRNNI